MILRNFFPQFAQTTSHGAPMQQDAEEFFSCSMQAISQALADKAADLREILQLEMEEKLTCTETDLEPPVIRRELFLKLPCNLSGGVEPSTKVNHLEIGIRAALEGHLVKSSSVLGKDAKWARKQSITKLPKILCVHYMRFFWKLTPNNDEHAGVKCKILRPINFQEVAGEPFDPLFLLYYIIYFISIQETVTAPEYYYVYALFV